MFTWKTSKGNRITLIKIGMTNCYFVEYEGLNILIDTGIKRYSEKLISNLKSLLRNSNKLNYLILTHTHYDHTQNAGMIQRELSPKVIVHKFENQFLKDGFTKFPKGTYCFTKIISNLGNRYAKNMGKYEGLHANIIVENEYLIESIEGIKIIETPGHTFGSISLILDEEIAIVGDTLFGVYKNSVFPPFADNQKELFKSWKKLLNARCNLFLPGYGKAIKKDLLEKEYLKRFSV